MKIQDRELKKRQEKYEIPGTVQDYIPIRTVYADGIMRCGKVYTKSYSFSDINYFASSQEDKESKFASYCEIINSMDSEAVYKISIINESAAADKGAALFMNERDDGLDALRREYREMAAPGRDGHSFSQKRIMTVSVCRNSYEEARQFLERTGNELKERFRSIGSRCEDLDADRKLKLLHGIYRKGEEYSFSINEASRFGYDFRDYICPDGMERHPDYLIVGERYVRTLFLKDYASYIKDTFLSDIAGTATDMTVSVDILPVSTEEAVREVERKLLGVETSIASWQRKQRSNKNFSAVIPYDMDLQRKETKEFLDDLTGRDQRMLFGLVTAAVWADSLDELDTRTETLKSTAGKHLCQLSVLKYQQTDGLNTALPIGVMPIKILRTLTTESLAVFMPFRVQEINEKGGIYIGRNAISSTEIVCNRENLVNQSAFILGVPGSGKSMCAKSIICQIILSTDDDILICDPEGEYGAMLREMNLSDASVINISSQGKDRINAMALEDISDRSSYGIKSDFIMSLISRIDEGGINVKHKSVIDRCLALTYAYCERNSIEPTLTLLRDCLREQSEKEASEVALALELYTEGNLDIFGHEGNVDLGKRITSFDIHSLGRELKSAALLVITDTILNRVSVNFKRGKRTHVFIDEFHVMYENEYSASFFENAWRQFRKRNAYPTAITQNVEYLLSSVKGSTMLSNSEFIIMLSQSYQDRQELMKLLNISENEMSYAVNAESGCGVIKYGGAVVPFRNVIEKDTRLYSLMSTKPGEGAFNLRL